MRVILICSLFVMCFLYSEAGSLKDMFPSMSDRIAMRALTDTVKSVMKPFGCLKLKPSLEFVLPSIDCLLEIAKDIKDETIKNKEFQLPSFKAALGNFTQCRLDKYELTENGEFSLDRYDTLHKSITYIKSNPEDLILLNEVLDQCKGEVDVSGLYAVKGAMVLEKCIYGLAIDRCTEDRGIDSVGVLLPTMYALNSLFDSNKACDSVERNEKLFNDYVACVEEEESSFEEIQVTLSMNPMEKVMQLFNIFKEIPEIECLIKISEDNGLSEDGTTNFSAVAKYVGKLNGWSDDDDLKTKVTGLIETCGNLEASGNLQRDVAFGNCFLPAFADICGLDNKLSSEVLFPLLNEEFLSSILNRINGKFDLIGLLEKLPV